MKKLSLTSTNVTSKYVNALIYGEAGVGKTTLCATAPNPIIISAEAGLLSLQDYDLPVYEIKTRSDCDDVYDFLTLSKEAKDKYQTVCLDSLSEIAEVLLDDELRLTKDARAAYGVMAREMNILSRGFRGIEYNVYFAAKQKKLVEDKTNFISYMPSVPGQSFLGNMPYLFDLVAKMDYFKQGTTIYRGLYTAGNRQYIAKDRSGRLAPIEKPDLTHVFNKILKKTAEAKTQKADAKPKGDKNAITSTKG